MFYAQETKYMKKGLFKAPNYEIFESIRKTGGGSILTGISHSLNPVLISDGAEDEIEILVVEGEMGSNKCRFINGYGPQEAADINKRITFFARLEEEIIKSIIQGSFICIQLDANAKLGPDVIKNDPHERSSNGELLFGILARNGLVVCNGSDLCSGLITRSRTTVNGEERSVIDFLIVCEKLFAYMTEMKVDEEHKYAVESYSKVGKQIKVTRADHNMIIGRFNLKVIKKITQSRKEIFKYDDEEGKKRFRELTSQNILTKCFEEEEDIQKASKRWLKELKNIIHRSFKKIRIGDRKKSSEVVNQMKAKHKLKNELDDILSELKEGNVSSEKMKKKHDIEDEIEKLDALLADAFAERNAAVIDEHFKELSNEDGQLSVIKMWSLKKKLSVQNTETPMAMQDSSGNLISGKSSLIKLYQTTYEERLSHKPIKEGWEDIQILKEELFKERMSFSSEQKSEKWDLNQVKKICKNLKSGKARDRDDLIFEIFKPDLAGNDLMTSLMHMFNGIKSTLSIPEFLQKMAVTSLFKNKGSKSNFAKSARGVQRIEGALNSG